MNGVLIAVLAIIAFIIASIIVSTLVFMLAFNKKPSDAIENSITVFGNGTTIHPKENKAERVWIGLFSISRDIIFYIFLAVLIAALEVR